MTHFTQFDIDTMYFKKVSKTKKGSNAVYICTSETTDASPRVQLNTPGEPRLTCPFGLSSFDDEPGTRMTLDISLEGDALVAFGKQLDNKILSVAYERKDTWFKGGLTDEQVKTMYYPIVQTDTTGKGYAPKLHTKANIQTGARQLKVLKMLPCGTKWELGEVGDMTRKFVKVMAICEVTNVWFQKLQFGATVLTTDVIIFPDDEREEFGFSWGDAPPPIKAGTEVSGPATTSSPTPDTSEAVDDALQAEHALKELQNQSTGFGGNDLSGQESNKRPRVE